jgi:hypothetical protein
MLREQLDAAVAAMHWLTDADTATVELARQYAARIDEALEFGEGQEVTKALYLGPHLLHTLRELGGTPQGRATLQIETEVKGKLAMLRERRGA